MEIDREFHTPLDVERASQASDELGWWGGRMSMIDSSLRSSPGKWTGIAAGVGLLLGMSGRLLRRRAARRDYAHFVLIESR